MDLKRKIEDKTLQYMSKPELILHIKSLYEVIDGFEYKTNKKQRIIMEGVEESFKDFFDKEVRKLNEVNKDAE